MVSKVRQWRGFIQPLQPYFVVSAAAQYLKREMASSPISHFYSFQVSDAPTMALAVPDGSIDIIFNCNRDNPTARVCGSTLLANKIELQQGQRYFGVRFMPGVMPDFLDLAAAELFGHEIGFDDAVPGMRKIFEQIVMNNDFRQQTDLFMQMFGSRLNRSSASLLLQIIDIILRCHGAIRIEQLEQKTLYTARYIQRIFHDNLGMSPKFFCCMVRFQYALFQMNHGTLVNFASMAQELGYADQSHFSREFKQFSTLTPKNYLSYIQTIRYQQRIQYL
ncbi:MULTISPECIES: helix-turn-helix domain-containing protein [Klebsiella]|nr:helix-turn-helix domain-containing protein [Klebsiella variicola]MCD9672815.1 helix-turn-helix domain-containing protein [Klebsiella variicola subsp. variicola]